MIRRLVLLAACLMPLPAAAADTWNAVYQAYVAGLNAVELRASFGFDPAGYRIAIRSRTVGMTKLFVDGQQLNKADGLWASAQLNSQLRPRNFYIDGTWRGSPRRAHIVFGETGPAIRELQPAERSRQPIPDLERRDAIDPLSVLAALSRLVAERGTCDGEARVYDGRKLEATAARTVGWEVFQPSTATIFTGRALRCDVELRLIGGFLPDSDRADQAKPRRGTVWLAAPAPGAPLLPVMFKLQISWLGEATVYLTELGKGTDPAGG